MLRALFFFVVVLLLAFGASWLADHPGSVAVTFGGREYLFSTFLGLVALVVAAVVLLIVWSVLRFVFQIPTLMSVASANRRRQRGYATLSRGMVAVSSGDVEGARRYAAETDRLLAGEPMALLLKAQAAQLSGDRAGAEHTFTAMLDHPETRALALRGLYMEATRRGDAVAALAHAEAAQKIATLPWSAQALLQAQVARGEWLDAIRAVERGVAARIVDRATGNRQRAVLLAAMAQDLLERQPAEALDAARDAVKLAPDLVPAAAIAGSLLSRKGDLRKASKLLETSFIATPHPDLAHAYVFARPGDSAADRLARAEVLAASAPDAPESRLTVAHAALDARDFATARSAMAPLVAGPDRPTRRSCLMMADIEEAENGETGALFEWLQRASHGAADHAWVADGVVSDRWHPLSPTSGRLDAYRWEVPPDHRPAMPLPARLSPASPKVETLPPTTAAPEPHAEHAPA